MTKILNLADLLKSEVRYEVSNFPDGQQQVKVHDVYWVYSGGNEDHNIPNCSVQIRSRLNNFRDLELICCTVASLRERGVKKIYLYVPYFLGSRSDRKFELGSNNYLKTVICPIINSLNLDSVTVIDPHSDVLEACLNNFNKKDNTELVRFALREILRPNTENSAEEHDYTLISPDAGANKKIFHVALKMGYKGEIITCSKSRDTHGQLSRVSVPVSFEQLKQSRAFVIIDDICDGGATFLNIAKEIKEQRQSAKIYLVVTHGIFSKGFTELNKYFDGIYCTNSYVDMNNPTFNLLNDDKLHKLKQLNVF